MQREMHGKKPPLAMVRFLLLIFFTSFYLKGFGQGISLSLKKAPLETAFRQIEAQVPQRFVYTSEMAEQGHAVTLHVEKVSLKEVLDLIFREQAKLDYSINENFITVRFKTTVNSSPVPLLLQGRVLDEEGRPLARASVTVKGKQVSAISDENGNFEISNVALSEEITVSCIGYQAKTVAVNAANMVIRLAVLVSQLDETVIMAYGTTTKRLNTGNISKISSEDIAKQPVSNVLAAMEGRVPGLVVTATSGLPGSQYKLLLRGNTSVGSTSNLFSVSNDPLIIIDGIPYSTNNSTISYLTSALNTADLTGGLSPLAGLNPGDVESIEILKDADATSIYGSRGANGVILITTKKGKPGKLKADVNAYSGASRITRPAPMLNTAAYVKMRKEAFANDNVSPSITNAPDLLIYDTTRYTDFVNYFIGGKAKTNHLEASVSGGTALTQFLIGGSFHREKTVFPVSFHDDKASIHLSLDNQSANQKFSMALNTTYSYDKNFLPAIDFAGYTRIAPNTPSFYDSSGSMVWEYNGLHFYNPMASLLKSYTAVTNNLLSNFSVGYFIRPQLQFKTSLGYNSLMLKESRLDPLASEDQYYGTVDAVMRLGYNNYTSWIAEPQLIYKANVAKARLEVLAGGTFQSNSNDVLLTTGSGFSNDNLVGSLSAAQALSASSFTRQYRYQAFFGRINYNLSNRYIVNLNGRRDGSSRFGDEKRFANFGSIGAAWIFSQEKLFSKWKFLSHGKIRASYGSSGNDKISDYQYLNRWKILAGTSYQGIVGLTPLSLYNPEYRWERNRKKEAAIDLDMFHNRLQVSASYYINRSDNQLIQYALPTQTGFLNVVANFPALVQNTGVEFEISSTCMLNQFKWVSTVNVSAPKNKLIAFPDLATSSYSKDLVIGQPLSARGGYRFTGFSSDGVYQFEDVNADGIINAKDRVKNLANRDQKFYGNFINAFTYKGLQADLFFEFRKQQGPNYLFYSVLPPGALLNQPAYVLNHWAKPGDNAATQKFTTTAGTPAYNAFNLLKEGADISYTDASFIRLKNVSLSYRLPSKWLKKAGFNSIRAYLLAQNLITITKYKGADPETQLLTSLPPLKTLTAGIQFNF